MFTVSTLLILFVLIFKFLSTYIKKIRTGDPNENNLTYWMFSYDFKSNTKKDWEPEDKELLKKKESKKFFSICALFKCFLYFFTIK